MYRLTLIAVLALSGCSTPAELRQGGDRYTHETKLAPREAAICLGRAAEEWRGDQQASWRESDSGSYELIIGPGGGRNFIADITPTATGSSVVMYAPSFVLIAGSMAQAMFKRC